MRELSRENLNQLLKNERISKRLARDLRFVPEEIGDWDNRDFLAISNKSGAEGILLIDFDDMYIIQYKLTKTISNNHSGRLRPITCDLCYTWQRGTNSASITLLRKSDGHTFTYLCCANLLCSLHVRDLTHESQLSRTQLREDITKLGRINRHKNKVQKIMKTLDQKPVELSQGDIY